MVSWESGKKKLYGRVREIRENMARISLFSDGFRDEECTVSVDRLTDEPPVVLTADALRRFARFEIRYPELVQGRAYADKEIPEAYRIVPEDLKAAVLNCRKYGMSDGEFENEYFWPLYDEFYDSMGIRKILNKHSSDFLVNGLPDQDSVFCNAWDILDRLFNFGMKDVSLDDVVEEVRIWEENKDKALAEMEFSRAQKRGFLSFWNDDRLVSVDEEIKALYRKIMDSLCEEDDPEALKTKAYACYGHGNAAYGQDWDASQACLLRLMEVEPDARFANTLGYMYYYGRCTGGVPEYDKAFYYFSIGAAGGYYESRYKLSDMFLHGYGVAKDPKVAAGIIWELYPELLKEFRRGNSGCNFADVALRAGNVWKEGTDCWDDPHRAYYFYLQAQYAIRKRMTAEDFFGDQEVAARIEQAIAEVLPETGYRNNSRTARYDYLQELLGPGLDDGHRMEMKIRRITETEARLTFRIVPYDYNIQRVIETEDNVLYRFIPDDVESEKYGHQLLVTAPAANFCGLMKKVTVLAKHIRTLDVEGGTDTVLFDRILGDEFYLYGRKVAEIDAEYTFTAPKIKDKKHTFVSVTFTPDGRRYDYLCDVPLNVGDRAVVEGADGEVTVTVVNVFEKPESELALPLKKYKKVIRGISEGQE